MPKNVSVRPRTMEVVRDSELSDLENMEPSESEQRKQKTKKKNQKSNAAAKLTELQTDDLPEPVDEEDNDQDYSKMINLVCDNPKGTKGVIKKLFSNYREAIDSVEVNLLRRAIWTPHFVATAEGQKFCARAFEKITPHGVMMLISKSVKLGPASSDTCVNYGEMIYHAWKYACSDRNMLLQEDIEDKIIIGLFTNVIMLDIEWASKFSHMLTALRQGDKIKLDPTLFKCTLPVLWRSLKAANPKIRYNASIVLLDFYPLCPIDANEKEEYLKIQHTAIHGMLFDECVAIRQVAIKKIMVILSNLFTYVPTASIKAWCARIVDELSKDIDAGTRIAVFESVKVLLPIPSALNVTQKILECICPTGINDRNERVRLAAFQLLNALKGHRFLKFFQIVDMAPIMARFEIEESESIRREIVRLIFRSFFLIDADQADVVKRTFKLVQYGRNCALTFHRLVYTLKLINVEEAARHLRALALAAYDCSTKLVSGDESMINDGDMTYTKVGQALDETVNTIGTMSNLPLMDEKNPHFRRTKILIECGIVLYYTMKKALGEPEQAKENFKLESMNMKVFVKLFKLFNKTSLIGPAMLLGSLLPCPSTDGITRSVLTLLNEKAVDDCIIEPYLEASANWNIENIFGIIHTGLDELQSCTNEIHSPQRKRGKTEKERVKLLPNDSLLKAIHYLKFILRSYTINKKITSSYQYQLEEFYKKLKQVRVVVDHRVSSDSPMLVSDEAIIGAYEMKQTIAAILLNGKHETPEEALVYVRDLCMDLVWFQKEVIPHLAGSSDENIIEFLIQLSNKVLGQISVMFLSFDFSSVPTISKAPSFIKPSQNIGSPDIHTSEVAIDFIDTASSLALAFCRSATPLLLAGPVLRAARQLFDVHPALINDTTSIQEFFSSWIVKSYIRGCWPTDMDENDEKSLADAYWALWKSVMDHPEHTSDQTDRHFFNVVAISLNLLVATASEAEKIKDPREADFEMPPPLNILLHRVIFRHPALSKTFIDKLGGFTMSSSLTSSTMSAEDILYRLGACAQLAHICKSAKVETNYKSGGNLETPSHVVDVLNAVKERMQGFDEILQEPGNAMLMSMVQELLLFR